MSNEKLKLCFISDTHNKLDALINFIPECDYLIHCGDMTNFGTVPELAKVNNDFGIIKNRGKVKKDIIIIAGNHDIQLEKDIYLGKNIFTNAVYLENSHYYLKRNNGEDIKIYGSPMTPMFCNWAFMKHRGEDIDRYWRIIPDDTEILITHGPSYGFLDKTDLGENCGCQNLTDRIKQLKNLKIHAFGHIHFSHGILDKDEVRYINAATMGENYKRLNPPILIEF